MPLRKFYLPYGSLSNAPNFPVGAQLSHLRMEVTVHWFVLDRVEPVSPYNELLMNYKSLSEDVKRTAEATVNEFFTEEEFHLFRSYLRERYGQDVRTAVLVPPVSALHPDNTTRAGADRPYGRRRQGSLSEAAEPGALAEIPSNTVYSGFVPLGDEPDYPLPFLVCGYYAFPVRSVRMERTPLAPVAAVAAADAAEVDEEEAAEDEE